MKEPFQVDLRRFVFRAYRPGHQERVMVVGVNYWAPISVEVRKLKCQGQNENLIESVGFLWTGEQQGTAGQQLVEPESS